MKYAIDRYAIGIEKEVSADDFDGKYIPGRHNRFYCPECGEIVYFRAKGGNNPSHFYHQEKTDSTPECDKRVDGRSSLSLNERVGLPVYLTTFIPGRYQLNIGFPSIGSEMLQKAASANYSVEISFGSQFRTVKVNSINFIEDETSLVPVNFIPTNGRNYTITISGDRTIFGLHRKWSDYADGFDQGGAIFTYEESYGKKIRRGDSISTHRNYYAVTKQSLPSYSCIQRDYLGVLSIGRDTFSVYRIQLNISTDEESIFSSVSRYFKRYFGVWLLECAPELIPVWPPIVQQDNLIPTTNCSHVICAVSSGNACPNVYIYSDYGAPYRIEPSQNYNGVKTVEVTPGKRPITLSVDRKYVGREVSFILKEIPESKYHYKIAIRKGADSLALKNIDEKVLSSEFTFLSNSKMDLYAGSKGKSFRRIPVREETTIVSAMKNTIELFVTVESAVIQLARCEESTRYKEKNEEQISQLQVVRQTKKVPIPRWAEYFIRTQKNSHNNALYNAIMATVEKGQIPIGVLKLLRKIGQNQ